MTVEWIIIIALAVWVVTDAVYIRKLESQVKDQRILLRALAPRQAATVEDIKRAREGEG